MKGSSVKYEGLGSANNPHNIAMFNANVTTCTFQFQHTINGAKVDSRRCNKPRNGAGKHNDALLGSIISSHSAIKGIPSLSSSCLQIAM